MTTEILWELGVSKSCKTLFADSYLVIKEITSKKEEILHSETKHMIDNQMDIEIAKVIETPNVTQILQTNYYQKNKTIV